MEVRPEKLQFFESVLRVYVAAAVGPTADAIPPQNPSKQSRRGSVNEAEGWTAFAGSLQVLQPVLAA